MSITSEKHDRLLAQLQQLHIDELQDIQLNKALYLPSIYAYDQTKKGAFKHKLKTILGGLNDMEFDISHHDVLFLITIYNRKDHDTYYQQIQDIFPEKDRICLGGRKDPGKFRKIMQAIAFKGLLFRWKKYRQYYKLLAAIDEPSARQYLSAELLRCTLILSRLDALQIKPKAVFSFFDGNLFENLTIQYFQKKGAVCFTNQHGQPVFLGHDEEHLNQCQIHNFSSDYFLAKGEYTRQQFVNAGFSPDRIKVVGSMTYQEAGPYTPQNSGVFAVFLDCPLFDYAAETNRRMVEASEQIAQALQMQYLIKMHPLDSREQYAQLDLKHCHHICEPSESLQDVFADIEFGIMGASAIYLDLLTNGIKPFQLVSEVNDYPIVETSADKFHDVEEFVASYSKWNGLSISEKDAIIQTTLHRYVSDQDCRKEIRQLVDAL